MFCTYSICLPLVCTEALNGCKFLEDFRMSKGTSPTPQKKKSGWPKGKKRGPKSVGTIVLPKGITMTSDILENTRAYAAKHLRKILKNFSTFGKT